MICVKKCKGKCQVSRELHAVAVIQATGHYCSEETV